MAESSKPLTDHQRFAVLMALLGTAFGESGMPKARAEVYWEHLRDIPLEAMSAAVSSIIRTRKYSSIPTIAEIREAALGKDDDIEAAALAAWGSACRAVSYGAHPTEDSLLVEAIRVAFGGWAKFGETDPGDAIADRAHFLRVYKSLARARRERGEPALGPHRPAGQLKGRGERE